jgi:hypothetical protein
MRLPTFEYIFSPFYFTVMFIKLKYPSIITAALLFNIHVLQAQHDLKAWGAVSFQMPAAKSTNFSLEHLRAYNTTSNWENEFNQVQGRFETALSKNTDLFIGDLITLTPGSNEIKNRVFVRAAHKIKLGNFLRWQSSLQAELYSKNENRYHYRGIVSSRLYLKKRLTALHLSPSVTGFLFYNLGGKPIQYYDDNKQPLVKQTPDGFHRGRIVFNINSKISERFNLSLYYMVQREFNILNNTYHSINYYNPVTGKILRPFDNYNVAGIALGISLLKSNNGEAVISN